jgi:hypothetical protein
MITIGRMAEKYGMLPSQVEQSATTYDLMISDVLATYENFQQQKSSGKVDPSVYKYTQEELSNMIGKARGD